MKHRILLVRLFLSTTLLFVAACGGSGSDSAGTGGLSSSGASGGDSGTGGVTSGGATACGSTIAASSANDYMFASQFTIDVTTVKPRAELSFDWSGVTKDFLGHTVNPLTDIDMVTMILWNLPQASLEQKLNDDALAQSDVAAIAMFYTKNTATTATLSDLTEFGQPIDHDTLLTYLDDTQFDPSTHTYTLMAATGTTAGKGTRMLKAFRLDASSSNSQITIDSSSTQLQSSANLTSLQPVQVTAGTPGLSIDWSNIATNALGHPFDPTAITSARVASYSQTPAELQAQFLDLDLIAQDLWTGPVASGTSLDLSTLTDSAGAAFPGIDDSHTWIVALTCGACTNPAPWYLSIIKPCATN